MEGIMKPKQTNMIYMIFRYLCISCVIAFGIISIVASGGGGGDDGGGGGRSAPEISNFSFSPSSTTQGSGGGTISVSGILDFVDNDGNVSTLTLSIFDSNDNKLDSNTNTIQGISGLTSGSILGSFDVNTSVMGDYTFEIYVTDTTNLSSNILSGIFTVVPDDTKDLDATFGNGGIALYGSTPGNREQGFAVKIQADGKILVAGFTNNSLNSTNDVLLLRYNTDGTLDNTFGSNGIVLYDGGSEEAFAVSIQPDGKILVVGEINENVLVLRYNSDGTLDNTFGTNGAVSTDLGSNDYGYAVALQTDGKIVVSGQTISEATVLRYNTDGTLDNSFGTNGVVKYAGDQWDAAYGVSIQPDDKIVITGTTSDSDVLVLRFNSDGSLDNTFGTNGVFTYDNVSGTGKAVKIQPDGKILVVGGIDDTSCYSNALLMLRLTDDGSLDNTFGSNGVVTYNRGQCDSIYGKSFTLQPDGKIIVVGDFNSNILVLRYNTDGTLDTSFSEDGVGMYSIGDYAIGTGVDLQTDGKIVVSGFSISGADDDILTIRIIGQ
jgi:uncharacterized delta-60 repeat protein